MATDQLETATRDNCRWIAVTNTTAAVFISALDGAVVIISLPAVFHGIHLDPLSPSNISELLWVIMGVPAGAVDGMFAAPGTSAIVSSERAVVPGMRAMFHNSGMLLTPTRARCPEPLGARG